MNKGSTDVDYEALPQAIRDAYTKDKVTWAKLSEWDNDPRSVIMVRLTNGHVFRWQLFGETWENTDQ